MTREKMELDHWRKLKPLEWATQLSELAETHSKEIPESLYVGIMNASKVMYDKLVADEAEQGYDDLQSLLEAARTLDPTRLKYEVEGRRIMIEDAKRAMKDFKPVVRITKQLKQMAIESLCKHMGVRLPVYTWACLRDYGHAQHLLVGEQEIYRMFKDVHNLKLLKYKKMYEIETAVLCKLTG